MKQFAALFVSLLLLVGCSSSSEPEDDTWVEDQVSFSADGLTIHGTYRHPSDGAPVPAALLISESGQTDRNGDNAVVGPVGNMRQLAEHLSGLGVATLRYDKVGTGRTGLGPYADNPTAVVSAVYTAGAKAALRFLADQPGTDKAHLSAYGLGEGATHAMALAVDTASDAPRLHSLGLLQPLPGRYLDIITSRVKADVAAAVKDGAKTQRQADDVVAQWTAAVEQVRAEGTVPSGQLPDGLGAILNPGNAKAVHDADAVDPLAEAAKVPAGMPVLLTCSDSDGQSRCEDLGPLRDALAHTDLTFVELKGVNHVLRDDPSDNLAEYAKPKPLSGQLTSALDRFVRE